MKFHHQMRVLGMDGRPSQDCAGVQEADDGSLRVVLADGVGGQAGGREAARRAVEDWLTSEYDPPIQMAETDSLLSRVPAGGLTTAIYLRVNAEAVSGASVGDSQAWLQEANGSWTELTDLQRLRPFLGSGEAIPMPFSRVTPAQGRLLVCSDGLWRFVERQRMLELATKENAEEMLLAAALPNADSPVLKAHFDDLSFVLVCWDSSR